MPDYLAKLRQCRIQHLYWLVKIRSQHKGKTNDQTAKIDEEIAELRRFLFPQDKQEDHHG